MIAIPLCSAACDPAPSGGRKTRTDVVAGSAKQTPAPLPTLVASSTKPKRTICAGQNDRDAPEALLDGRAAAGAKPPSKLSFGRRWVWINVWAAWCEPCKKEMPMLIAWRDKLKAAGIAIELAFLSIDEDERELMRFLGKQPPAGVRSSFWLPTEERRKTWFESLGYEDEPTLPVHAFVRPEGKLACLVDGVLEPTDFAALQRLMQ